MPTGKRKTHQGGGGGKLTRSTPSPQSSSYGPMSSSTIRPMHNATHSHSMPSSSPHSMQMTGSSPQGPSPHVGAASTRQQQQQHHHHHHQPLPPPQSVSHHLPHHVQQLTSSHSSQPLQSPPSNSSSSSAASNVGKQIAVQSLEHPAPEPDTKITSSNGNKMEKEEKKHPGMVIGPVPVMDNDKVTAGGETYKDSDVKLTNVNNELSSGPPSAMATTQPAAAPPSGIVPLASQIQLTVNHIPKAPRKIISPKGLLSFLTFDQSTFLYFFGT